MSFERLCLSSWRSASIVWKPAAESAALADAGVASENAKITRTEMDYENGKLLYEVEFTANGVEYDYLLKAADGTVVSREREPADDTASAGASALPIDPQAAEAAPAAEAAQTKTDISIEKAKSIALADAGIAEADVIYTKSQPDTDDEISVYDIEFYTAVMEYDYEINALTGAVHSRSQETHDAVAESKVPHSNSYIGVDQAKTIAVQHAGASVTQITFTKAKLEDADGRTEYEIEFYLGRTEYEYTIDASNGAILAYDSEVDD